MSWTILITVASAASGGDVPVPAVVSWTDTAGPHSENTANYPPNGTFTATVTGPASVAFTATPSEAGFGPLTLNGTAETGSLLFKLPSTGPTTTSCFIATAAYGTETAPEVKLLQGFRDNVLRRTRWGRQFFDDLWKHYYQISPPIAEEMNRDPELRRVVRWAIVEPWLNYMKLMMSRPDFHGINFDGLEPELVAFLRQLQSDANRWLKGIEVPKSFRGRDPEDAVHELNIILGLVLLRTDGKAYLEDLEKRGELPLQYPRVIEGRLRSALTDAGRAEEEVISILYGTSRP